MGVIAKYKFDHNVYADLIPVFNDGYSGYSITDEVAEDGSYTIRTIECDTLPTMMRFGGNSLNDSEISNIDLSLLEVLDMNTSGLNVTSNMFRHCENLTSIACEWNVNNVTDAILMFDHCYKLQHLDVSKWNTTKFVNIYAMFRNCSLLSNIDVSNWNITNKVTSVYGIFEGCSSMTSVDITNWDLSNVTDIYFLFSRCEALKYVDLRNITSASIRNSSYFISACYNLTTLDISNLQIDNANVESFFGFITSLKYIKCNMPLTIQTISSQLPTRTSDDPGTIIYQGAETLSSEVITTLNSKGWNVVASPQLIAEYKYDSKIYKNLIPVFNEGYMGFVEDEEVDENGIVTRVIEHVELPKKMRFGQIWIDSATDSLNANRCKSLLEILDMNVSKIINVVAMFRICSNVTKINCDWSNLQATDLGGMFQHNYYLESLNLESLNTVQATNISNMFYDCIRLSLLDISNFNLDKVTQDISAFARTTSLTDIGMIYCDQSTINKVASLLPTDHNITIWVESDDILQYDQYAHITYKTQKVQDTVHLNSPLLKGDTIEVIDGKTYHVHRYGKVVLDGSEGWQIQNTYQENNTVCFMCSNLPYSKKAGELNFTNDRFINYRNYPLQTEIFKEGFSINTSSEYGRFAYIRLDISRLSVLTLDNFKQWLQANPTTVIYELATPYYELISEEPLELTLLDTTDNTINNNSILPSNMTIANKELSTIAIKPSTTYTLSFDKSNVDSEVTIDICGGQQITTVLNRIELTTPSELGSGIRFISSDGCIVSNVRLLEGILVENAIPKETFEGLKSSFDDGYIIGENLANEKEDYFYEETGNWGNSRIDFKRNLKANTTYTLVRKVSDIKYGLLNGVTFYDMAYYTDGTSKQDHNCWYGKDDWYISKYTPTKDVTHFVIIIGNDNSNNGDIRPRIVISDYMIFEGDHTHLSEAELMRYIEKGTSYYEEEDYNHVGKYKVQYKVTGKNKFDKNKELQAINYNFNSENHRVDFNDDYIKVKYGLYGGAVYLGSIGSFKKGTYTISCECYSETLDTPDIHIGYFVNDNWKHRQLYQISFNTWEKITYTFTLENDTDSLYLQFQASGSATKYNDLDFRVRNIQLEEGTVATEYEPYKEDIKTYYLSSPLLEGDTIEDVNGVATHVKRYGKVVLDGSENWNSFEINPYNHTNVNKVQLNFSHSFVYQTKCNNTPWYSNYPLRKLAYDTNSNIHFYFEPVLATFFIDKSITSLDDWKSRLKERPMELVCQLASPIYETISEESILLDSYTNGHLDLSNENIPIQKTEFRNFTKELAYLQPSTDYIVRFSSDNIGIAKVYLDSSVKEINVVKGINEVIITTPSTIVDNNIIIDGIGFNVSNVQVIADVIKDGDIKDFDYFKGLQSSFEDGLVTDENDENYGKYKVECKIVGKNKFDVNEIGRFIQSLDAGSYNNGVLTIKKSDILASTDLPINLKRNIPYTISFNYKDLGNAGRTEIQLVIYYEDGTRKMIRPYNLTGSSEGKVVYIINNTTLNKTIRFSYVASTALTEFTNIQIEEGTQATEYEPYKESIHTLYLNSPLLKGDKLVVHNGKLCHYHKMGMVVLDGSDDENWLISGKYVPFVVIHNVGLKPGGNFGHVTTKEKICTNTLQPNIITSKDETDSEKGIYVVGSGELNQIRIRLTDNDTVDSVKQWLQDNPTTVVYELAEPYYEPIEPQISQYSFSAVKDGDMEIITALPIEIDLTYRTDINGVSSIEEQIASIQESTDISNIIDEEVDE